MPIAATLLAHFARYPAMQLQDVYKLIHQAALGSEHAVRDAESAGHWLGRELAEMGTGPTEPLVDPLSEDTGLVRIHLRPYIAAGNDPERLLEAFICTANHYKGEPKLLEVYWGAAVELAEGGQIPFSVAELRGFFAPLQAQGFPALHHSPEYRRLYRPAYRLNWQKFYGE
jgi:hypothetical protein